MHVNLKIKRWKASLPFQNITFIAISEMSSSLNYHKLHTEFFWFGRTLIPSFVSSVLLIVTGIFSLAIFSFDLFMKKVNDIFWIPQWQRKSQQMLRQTVSAFSVNVDAKLKYLPSD